MDSGKDSLITIESTELTVKNCLEAKPMIYWLNRERRSDITKTVDMELSFCLELLQVSLSSQAIKAIVNDMIEKYKFDALEDILLCLKNGRNGAYGQNYNKFNLIIFTGWMREHLTEKSMLREAKVLERNNSHEWKNRGEYLKSVEAGNLIQKQIKKLDESKKMKVHQDEMKEFDYQNFKNEYLKKQSEAEKIEEVDEVKGDK